MLHGYGLPEKLWKLNPDLKDITYSVSTSQDSALLAMNKENYKSELKNKHGYSALNKIPPADLCFVCQDTTKKPIVDQENEEDELTPS